MLSTIFAKVGSLDSALRFDSVLLDHSLPFLVAVGALRPNASLSKVRGLSLNLYIVRMRAEAQGSRAGHADADVADGSAICPQEKDRFQLLCNIVTKPC